MDGFGCTKQLLDLLDLLDTGLAGFTGRIRRRTSNYWLYEQLLDELLAVRAATGDWTHYWLYGQLLDTHGLVRVAIEALTTSHRRRRLLLLLLLLADAALALTALSDASSDSAASTTELQTLIKVKVAASLLLPPLPVLQSTLFLPFQALFLPFGSTLCAIRRRCLVYIDATRL